MKLSLITILLFLFCWDFSAAQKVKSDSLFALIKKDKDDTSKVNHMNDLAKLLQNQFPDSSITICQRAIHLSEALNYNKGLSNSFLNLGVSYYYKGDFSSTHDNLKKAETIIEELLVNSKNDLSLISIKTRILRNIGNTYVQQGNYSSALDYFIKTLKICENIDDKIGIERIQGNIGVVYANQNNYSKALEYDLKAYKTAEGLNDQTGMYTYLGNLGIIYREKGDFQNALTYYFKSLNICEKIGDKYALARNYNNIGITYDAMHQSEKAMEFSSKALEIDKEMNNQEGLTRDYCNLGNMLSYAGKYSESFDCLYKALTISKKIGATDRIRDSYNYLSELYASSSVLLKDTLGGKTLNIGEMRLRSLDFYKAYISYRDSLNNEEVHKKALQKEMQYEFDKKEESMVIKQEKERELAAANNKKQKLFLFLIASVALAILVIAFIIFRSLRITRSQKDIIEEQKIIVEEKQKEVLDSIHYAKRIQQSLLPTEKYIDKSLKRLKK